MIYNFYHITDPHYYSKKNFAGDPYSFPQFHDAISFRESEEIFKKALEIVLKDNDTKTAIFTGDMTNHGDKESHEEVLALLKDFTEKGGKPFVTTDSHDYPWFNIFKINEKGEKVNNEHLSREQVIPMYNPFGRDKAVEVYDGDDTTFIAEIDDGLFYIYMGYDLTSDEGKHDPVFSAELMDWVKSKVRKVKNDGGTVVCASHWPIILPSPIYEIMGEGNTFVNGEKCLRELADEGVEFFFSGHAHIHTLKLVKTESGNRIYNIQTSALSGFPPKMRKVTIDTDKGLAKIRTIELDVPELNLGMSLTEYTKQGFLGLLESVPYNMEHDVKAFAETEGGITLPKEFILKHPHLIRFLGKRLNGLTYGKAAKFSKKYHGLKKADYEHVKDESVVNFAFDLAEKLFAGNQNYHPDTVEYKIAMGVAKKCEKICNTLKIDTKDVLKGFTFSEILEPLLYNGGFDDDNFNVIL